MRALRIGIITDTHFGARNDNQNFNDYFYKFYENVFFPTLKDNNITTCVHMGDVVDRRKFISFKTASDFRKRFIDKFKEMGIERDDILGNHDTYYKNTNKVNSPALVLYDQKGINVFEDPVVKNYDGLDVALVPWINNENYARIYDSTGQFTSTNFDGTLRGKWL